MWIIELSVESINFTAERKITERDCLIHLRYAGENMNSHNVEKQNISTVIHNSLKYAGENITLYDVKLQNICKSNNT